MRLLWDSDAMGLISPACKFRGNFFRTICTPFQPVSLRDVLKAQAPNEGGIETIRTRMELAHFSRTSDLSNPHPLTLP